MNEHVIDFAPSGRVSAMQRDSFDLGFLGRQQIKRASEIVWLEEQQQWQILIEGNTPGAFDTPLTPTLFGSYDGARAFEVRALNACRAAQLNPTSPQAKVLIGNL